MGARSSLIARLTSAGLGSATAGARCSAVADERLQSGFSTETEQRAVISYPMKPPHVGVFSSHFLLPPLVAGSLRCVPPELP